VYDILFVITECFSLALTVEALQGKTCQDSLLSGGGRSLGVNISGKGGRPWGIFFGFYKTRHILLSDRANCTVLSAVVLKQYRRVTEGQTEGRTLLECRALCSNAAKTRKPLKFAGVPQTRQQRPKFTIL